MLTVHIPANTVNTLCMGSFLRKCTQIFSRLYMNTNSIHDQQMINQSHHAAYLSIKHIDGLVNTHRYKVTAIWRISIAYPILLMNYLTACTKFLW